MTRGGQPDPARSHCPFLVLTPGISAQFLEADPDMSRANTGRFAGVFGMTCEREQLLAMQKVEGSNPFSRSFRSGSTEPRRRFRGPAAAVLRAGFRAGCPLGCSLLTAACVWPSSALSRSAEALDLLASWTASGGPAGGPDRVSIRCPNLRELAVKAGE